MSRAGGSDDTAIMRNGTRRDTEQSSQEEAMKSIRNHESARYGLYVALRHLDVRLVGADGERLEGLEGATYTRLPTLLTLLLAPVLGGAFVLAFPLLVIVVVAAGLARRLALSAAEHAVAPAGWEPATSYLNKGEHRAELPSELADLEALVKERRRHEDEQL
jgi:hypothetical protein